MPHNLPELHQIDKTVAKGVAEARRDHAIVQKEIAAHDRAQEKAEKARAKSEAKDSTAKDEK